MRTSDILAFNPCTPSLWANYDGPKETRRPVVGFFTIAGGELARANARKGGYPEDWAVIDYANEDCAVVAAVLDRDGQVQFATDFPHLTGFSPINF